MTKFDYAEYYSYIKGSSIDNQKHLEYLKNRKLNYVNQQEYKYIEIKTYKDGYAIPMDKIINIARLNKKNNDGSIPYDGSSLYELLEKGHGFRDSSLHVFFKKSKTTSIKESIDWLASKECAFVDKDTSDKFRGEFPSAYYYKELDRFLITSGQNRAFAGLLIGAQEYRVESISCFQKQEIEEVAVQSSQHKTDKNKNRLLSKIKKLFILN